MLKNIFIYLILLTPLLAFGGGLQKVKISRALDANLFKTEDGRLMRMAGVRCASLCAADSFFARKTIKYLQRQFTARTLYFLPDGTPDGDTLNVHFFRRYPLLRLNLNERFLAEGYGRYRPLSGRLYNGLYQQAQENARAAGRGIWDPANLKPPPPEPGTDIVLAAYAADFNLDSNDDRTSVTQVEWQHYRGINLLKLQLFFVRHVVGGEEGFKDGQLIGLLSYDYFGKFFGGGAGFVFAAVHGGEGLPVFGWPTFSFQLGLAKKIYLEANFITPLLQSYGSFSLNYRFAYPRGHVRLERSFASDEALYNLLVQAPVYKKILLNVQLFYNVRTQRLRPLLGFGAAW